MTVTVSVPFYGCAELVEKAVRTILAQTVKDLVCVVVGDGEEPPLHGITDSRLVVYNLPENHGAYFAQQLVLSSTPHEWYAPHAADDWSEPDHLERLQAYGTDVATGAVWYENGSTHKLLRKLYEVGLYRVARMLEIGGYNPAERIGQDTLTLRLMRLIAPMPATTFPTYHRVQRAGSLCTHPDTKKGAPLREQMKARNRAIFARCSQLRDPAAIRAYRALQVPAEIAYTLNEHIHELRERLT